MAPQFQWKLERWFDEAIGEVGRGRLQVLFERAWNALPLRGLQRLGQVLDAHLQPSAGLHGDEAALQVHSNGLNASEHEFRRLIRHQRLIGHLQ